MSNIIYYAQDR